MTSFDHDNYASPDDLSSLLATMTTVESDNFSTSDANESPEWHAVSDVIESGMDPIAAIVVPIVFSSIFVVGLIGNSLQVYTVVGNQSMRRSPPNVLIANLGVGDLLLLLVSVPFAATYYTLPGWSFGAAICKLSTGAYSASLTVSVTTLTALSADRYIAIVHPLTAMRVSTLRRSLMVTAVIWTLAVGLAAVEFVAANVRKTDNSIPFCDQYPPEWGEWYELFLPTFRFVAMFVGPMIAIGAFYACIARVLMASRSFDGSHDGEPVSTPVVVAKLLDRQDRERKRVAKVVMSFIVVFVVCWLPRHVYTMVHYWSDLEFNTFWHVFKIVGFCLTFIYSCVNPLALYMFSDEFRRYFDHYLFGRCCPSRRMRHRRDTPSTMFTLDTYRCGPGGLTRASRGSIGSTATPNYNVSVENLNYVAHRRVSESRKLDSDSVHTANSAHWK